MRCESVLKMENLLGPFDLPKKNHVLLILAPWKKTAEYEEMVYLMENF